MALGPTTASQWQRATGFLTQDNDKADQSVDEKHLREVQREQVAQLHTYLRKMKDDNTQGLTLALASLDEKLLNAPSGYFSGLTALHIAAERGLFKTAELLLRRGASASAVSRQLLQPIHIACVSGHEAIIDLLLNNGANVNAQDGSGATPLMEACRIGNLDLVQFLLKKGANTHLKNAYGWSPLHFASGFGTEKVISFLIQGDRASLDFKTSFGSTALCLAIKRRHPEIVQLLLKMEARVDMRDNKGRTPLIRAACVDHESIMTMILTTMRQTEKGQALINARDDEGWTALAMVAGRGFVAGTRLLLKHDAECNIQDNTGRTALHTAIASNHAEIATLILDRRRKILLGDREDRTLLMVAVMEQDVVAMDWILGHEDESAQINARDNQGSTALMLAVEHGFIAGVQRLIDAAADCSIQNHDKYTALGVAFQKAKDNEQSSTIMNHLLEASKVADFGDSDSTMQDALLWATGQAKQHDTARLILSKMEGNDTDWASIASTNDTDRWSAVEWAAYRNVPTFLWLLIAFSTRQSTEHVVKRALEKVKEFSQNELATRKQRSTAAHDSKWKSHNKDTTEVPTMERAEKDANNPALTNEKWKDVQDILTDPPYEIFYGDTTIYESPQAPTDLSKVLGDVSYLKACAVEFRKAQKSSSIFPRSRGIDELIYKTGPQKMMKEANSRLQEVVNRSLEELSSDSNHSTRLAGYFRSEASFSWVHLPATNVDWMEDLAKRIMKDENYELKEINQALSFLRDSWVQVPNETSAARYMRPHFVSMPVAKNKAGNSDHKTPHDFGGQLRVDPVIPPEDQTEPSSQNKTGAGHIGKRSASLRAVSALYIPYLSRSTEYHESADCDAAMHTRSQDRANDKTQDQGFPPNQDVSNDPRLSHLIGAKSRWQKLLKLYPASVLQGSPTLDEWHYDFAEDKASQKNRVNRNKDQILTKFLVKSADALVHWPIIRINQLWAWTIDDKWLITANSYPIDGEDDDLVLGVLRRLRRQMEAGRSLSQPNTAPELSRFIVDYCIGSYDRKNDQKVRQRSEYTTDEKSEQDEEFRAKQVSSIRQTFSSLINKIGSDETNLFDHFFSQTARPLSSSASNPDDEDEPSDAIKRAQNLYCTIKDIRNELNILKSVVKYQETVQQKLFQVSGPGIIGPDQSNLPASLILDDIKDLDDIADQIQSNARSICSSYTVQVA